MHNQLFLSLKIFCKIYVYCKYCRDDCESSLNMASTRCFCTHDLVGKCTPNHLVGPMLFTRGFEAPKATNMHCQPASTCCLGWIDMCLSVRKSGWNPGRCENLGFCFSTLTQCSPSPFPLENYSATFKRLKKLKVNTLGFYSSAGGGVGVGVNTSAS